MPKAVTENIGVVQYLLHLRHNTDKYVDENNKALQYPHHLRDKGARIAQLVVHGLAVHDVAGSILLWGYFPVEGIFPLELTWVQTPFPPKLLRMRV